MGIEIGMNIRSLRKQNKMSSKELADRIGLKSAQAILQYERGEREPSLETIKDIANALEVSLSKLLIPTNHKDLDMENYVEIASFLKYLGYKVEMGYTPLMYQADEGEEPTQDEIIINDTHLNVDQLEKLIERLKSDIDLFLSFNTK